MTLADALIAEIAAAFRVLPAPKPAIDKRARARELLATIEGLEARLKLLKADDKPETVREARSRKVDAFAALLVALFAQLQRGSITVAEYLAKVGDAFDAAVGDVPPDAEATIERLRNQAIERAKAYAKPAQLPEDHEDAPSEAAKNNWGDIVAGSLWAASFALAAYREPDRVWEWVSQEDPAVCAECDELDGQTFFLSDIQFWPGESDFGGDLPDGTSCGPNCRCEMQVSSAKATAPRVVKEAHCPHCGRWVARNVNVGATVYCPKDKAVEITA